MQFFDERLAFSASQDRKCGEARLDAEPAVDTFDVGVKRVDGSGEIGSDLLLSRFAVECDQNAPFGFGKRIEERPGANA